jgi:hypothetical protein
MDTLCSRNVDVLVEYKWSSGLSIAVMITVPIVQMVLRTKYSSHDHCAHRPNGSQD